MKILLAAAILATVGYAQQILVKKTNSADPWKLDIATKWGYAKAYYDYDFGYSVQNDFEQGETEGIMDMWSQLSLQSSASFNLDVNILGLHTCLIKINTTPFQLVPFWASLYFTHPAAVSKGVIAEHGAALEFGWEYIVGNVGVEYYMSDLVPNVSILDYLTDKTDYVVPDFIKFNADENNAGIQGWAQTNAESIYTEDPFLKWSLFDHLNKDGSMTNYGSYAFIPLVNDNIPELQ